jgi:flagellar biosynthesis protein FliQ
VPKMAAVGIALFISGHWMISEIVSFTNEMFARIPSLIGGA